MAGSNYIIGTSMTRFTKEDRSLEQMCSQVIEASLADAEIYTNEVDAVIFSNAVGGLITGQEMIRGQASLKRSSLLGKPIINTENACASGSSAFFLADKLIDSGAYEVILVVGAEKMTHLDKATSFAAIGTAIDLEWPPPIESDGASIDRSYFMDVYASMAKEYMSRYGATEDDFAEVVVKNRRHALSNPSAQFQKSTTVEEVLASRVITGPLTLLMCSSISNGAAALVVTGSEFAKSRRTDSRVRVLASVLLSGQERAEETPTVARRAATKAYEKAGVSPADIDVVEVHDGAAPAELITIEELGLADEGGALRMLRAGDTTIGGKIPVNPSGGLIARGHPIGATGCAQLVELSDQLRGRGGDRQVIGARIGLAENAGGYLRNDSAAATVIILGR
ncbi:thiolase family protein [Acidithrix sp. C25]|uniref:thiolase family protein n=1 Tax=Acidithrix sp. C25 TaxID=1671482 RepID=UPI00191B9575|nr:thiolase family protein [Acidithrix sp. C25]CAG4908133.1 unnamed protein product [Acidithrix sp. C25]